MTTAALVVRLALAAVFALAGAAKVAEPARLRGALRGFGIPAPLVPALAILVPVAELTTAGLLVPAQTAAWGAGAALVLLATFSAAIASALPRGVQPDCGCFGRVRAAAVGRRALARNAALAAGAVLVLALPAADAALSAVGALGVALVAQAAFSWQLLRQNGRLWQRMAELERRPGASA